MQFRSLALLVVIPPFAGSGPGAQEPDAVTYVEHVAPILYQRCTPCHRPGQAAPFPFLSYNDARKRGRMIRVVTEDRYMPPWRAVDGHGEFKGSMRLRQEEIDTLARWVQSGMAEGDPAAAPEPPSFPNEWWLGEPDMVVRMTEGFQVPADGPDIYRNFVIPLHLEEDKWLKAIAVRPTAPTVLHHIIFRTDITGAALAADGEGGLPGYDGMGIGKRGAEQSRTQVRDRYLESWAVGGTPRELPPGLAHKLERGTDLILASHFHPLGKAEVEQTTLGLYFQKEAPRRSVTEIQMPPKFGFSAGIDIPPGQASYDVKDTLYLPVDVEGVAIFAHAHYLGREIELTATRPGEETSSVFLIDDWDFTWQQTYHYKELLDLPAGTRLDVRINYDNSANNPDNPFDPPQRVGWGLYSFDEMAGISFLVVPRRQRDFSELLATLRLHDRRSLARLVNPEIDALAGLLSLDLDGDGSISESELGAAGSFLPLGRLQDLNRDGQVDADELRAGVRRIRLQDTGILEPVIGDEPGAGNGRGAGHTREID